MKGIDYSTIQRIITRLVSNIRDLVKIYNEHVIIWRRKVVVIFLYITVILQLAAGYNISMTGD